MAGSRAARAPGRRGGVRGAVRVRERHGVGRVLLRERGDARAGLGRGAVPGGPRAVRGGRRDDRGPRRRPGAGRHVWAARLRRGRPHQRHGAGWVGHSAAESGPAAA